MLKLSSNHPESVDDISFVWQKSVNLVPSTGREPDSTAISVVQEPSGQFGVGMSDLEPTQVIKVDQKYI